MKTLVKYMLTCALLCLTAMTSIANSIEVQSMISHASIQQNNEPKVRTENVNRQREIEVEVIASGKGDALFFVPTPLTPFYIDPNAVTQNAEGLYVLKEGYFIPDGLIPTEKQNNPAQLSTVLGRVLTVVDMLKKGIDVTVFCTTSDRPKADGKSGHVEPAHFKALQKQFSNLHIVTIPSEKYASLKDTLPAATYFFKDQIVSVYSQQIRETFDPNRKWGVDDQNRAFIEQMRTLCQSTQIHFPLDKSTKTNTPLRLSMINEPELTDRERKKFHFFG